MLKLAQTLSFLLLSSSAVAMRPIPETQIAIGSLRLAMPRPLSDVAEKGQMGINLEEVGLKTLILSWGRSYLEAQQAGKEAMREYIAQCEGQPQNPYCRFELLNPLSPRPRERIVISQALLNDFHRGQYAKLSGISLRQAFAMVKRQHEKNDKTAKSLLAFSGCTSPHILTAVAMRMEENWPEKKNVDLSESLYKKAIQCGDKSSQPAAAFRLGLIQIWKNDFSAADEMMKLVDSGIATSGLKTRAMYWRHYCALRLQKFNDAEKHRSEIIKFYPLSFHALLVNRGETALWQTISVGRQPHVSLRSVIRSSINPSIRAIEGLIELGAGNLAAQMTARLADEFDKTEPEVRLYLALLMSRIDQTLQNFRLLSDVFQDTPRMVSSHTMKLFFPLKFWDKIKAKNRQIDPMLLLALIRQESAFNQNARSIAGARGLMQVMPGTARYIAAVRGQKLFDPQINIDVGTKYFLKRLDQLDGDVELALAAYNAGIARVDQWTRRYPIENKMLFIDFIPFKETRDYITSILRNYYWYNYLYRGNSQFESRTGSFKASRRWSIPAFPEAKLIASSAKNDAQQRKTLPRKTE